MYWWDDFSKVDPSPDVGLQFFDVQPCLMISEIAFEYALNLFSGREIVILQKSKDHPRMIFCLVGPVSAISLFHASKSS